MIEDDIGWYKCGIDWKKIDRSEWEGNNMYIFSVDDCTGCWIGQRNYLDCFF